MSHRTFNIKGLFYVIYKGDVRGYQEADTRADAETFAKALMQPALKWSPARGTKRTGGEITNVYIVDALRPETRDGYGVLAAWYLNDDSKWVKDRQPPSRCRIPA